MAQQKKRVVLRISLEPETREQIMELSEGMGVTQVHLASRLVEWFTDQPTKIQLGILGIERVNDDEIARQLLTQIERRPELSNH